MIGLSTKLLAKLSLGDADRATRQSKLPAQACSLVDNAARFLCVEKSGREHIGVVEVFDESVSDALLTARPPNAPIAAVLSNEEHLASSGNWLEENVIERVSNITKTLVKALGFSHPLRVKG
jgi:hypothetical protein